MPESPPLSQAASTRLLHSYTPAPQIQATINRLHGIAMLPPGAVFGPRKLNSWLLTWIIDGPDDSELVLADRRVPAPRNRFFVLQPGMYDEWRFGRQGHSIHAFFHFHCQLPVAGWPPVAEWPLYLDQAEHDLLPALYRYLLHQLALPVLPSNPLIQSTMHLLLQAFLTNETTLIRKPRAAFPPMIEQALTELNGWATEKPAEKWRLPDLARRLHVHPDHLSRQFHKAVGVGPAEYLLMARLERGAGYLRDTDLTVESIAEQCGFHDQSHFSRTFKRVMGYAPSQFRQLATLESRAMRPTASLFHHYLKEQPQENQRLVNDIRDQETIRASIRRLEESNIHPFEAWKGRRFEPLDLSSQANRSGAPQHGWFGDEAPHPLPAGTVVLRGVLFELPPDPMAEAGYLLLGKDEGASQASFVLSENWRELFLLVAVGWVPKGVAVCARVRFGSDFLGEWKTIDGKDSQAEAGTDFVLTDWWPRIMPVVRRQTQPVLIPNAAGNGLSGVLYVARLVLPEGVTEQGVTIEAGEVPMLILGVTASLRQSEYRQA